MLPAKVISASESASAASFRYCSAANREVNVPQWTELRKASDEVMPSLSSLNVQETFDKNCTSLLSASWSKVIWCFQNYELFKKLRFSGWTLSEVESLKNRAGQFRGFTCQWQVAAQQNEDWSCISPLRSSSPLCRLLIIGWLVLFKHFFNHFTALSAACSLVIRCTSKLEASPLTRALRVLKSNLLRNLLLESSKKFQENFLQNKLKNSFPIIKFFW